MTTTSSIYNANDPYEQLISSIIRVESQPKLDLQAQQKSQETFQKTLSEFDSKLSAFNTLLKKFQDPLANPFQGRSVTVPPTAGFAVTAGDKAGLGSFSLQIERLAATDARLSQQYTTGGTSLRSFFDTNGEQTFSIDVAKPTADNPNNRVPVSVTVNPTGTTDEAILREISTAITDAMSAAATAGTIGQSQRPSASVVKETSDTARLSLRSAATGFQGRLGFSDSGDGLLALLGVSADAVATGTAGGQVTAIGTTEMDSALNAKFTLNGLTLYRSSNSVSDALPGVTLALNRAGDPATAFTVAADQSGTITQIEEFIKQYNDTLGYIERKTAVDPEAKTRGDFAGESLITGLRFGLRNDALQKVSGLAADAPDELADLGIAINRDGTLELKDRTKLEAALTDNADGVQALFGGTNGLAKRMQTRLDQFLGTDGFLAQRRESANDTVTRIKNRIKDWDDRLGRREDLLRTQFARLQEFVTLAQGQSDYFNSFFSVY